MSHKFDSVTDASFTDLYRVRETVLILNLAVAQISSAMKDGDDSVDVLSNFFTSMMSNVQAIEKLTGALHEGEEQEDIGHHCAAVTGQMQEAIMAFQFYDKLSQRLHQLSKGLASFGELVSSPGLNRDPDAWKLLQEDIKSRHTLETDKAMFDAILDGKSIEEALHHLLPKAEERPAVDIELF